MFPCRGVIKVTVVLDGVSATVPMLGCLLLVSWLTCFVSSCSTPSILLSIFYAAILAAVVRLNCLCLEQQILCLQHQVDKTRSTTKVEAFVCA